MVWHVEVLDERVAREIDSLPPKHKARFLRIVDLIESMGLPNIGAPYVEKLHGKLWEIRVRADSGVSRALYVVASRQRMIVVRAFVKKTQKTPPREIALALRRAKEAGLA